MKIIGTLCYYAESPTWLAACVASMGRFCDHVIALDGGYRLFPGATPSSGAPSHEAIQKAAEAVGVGLTHHIPDAVFEDNEIEKRNLAWSLAEAIAEPEVDWIFVLDADEVVIEHPATLREDLELTPLDVASASMIERVDWHADEGRATVARAGFSPSTALAPARRFFRAIPGLRCVGNHYTYIATRHGEQLTMRGLERFGVVPTLSLGVVLEHRSNQRDVERALRKQDYYNLRDATGAELDPEGVVTA